MKHNGTNTNKITTEHKNFLVSITPCMVVFCANICVMMLELAAGRLAAQRLGSSIHTWTTVIGVTLIGLAIGNYVGGLIADYYSPKKTIAGLFGIASITCIISIYLNNNIDQWLLFWQLSWPAYVFVYISMLFLLPSVFLGAIIPPAAKVSLSNESKTGRRIGSIYAYGAAGSIAGTFIAGFWLISAIGVAGIIWITSAVLLVVGLIYDPKSRLLQLWSIAIVLLSLMGISGNQTLENAGVFLSLRDKPDPNIIYQNETRYSYIRVLKAPDVANKRLFLQDRLLHSAAVMGDITNMQYEYERIFAAVTEQAVKESENPAFLTIGGGGFVFPRYLKHYWPAGKVDVVEIDPEVPKAAIAAFWLEKNHGLNIFIMDGRNFVDDLIAQKQTGKDVAKYDLIYEDAYDNFSPPYQLTTREFNENIHSILKEDGFYLLNLIDIYNSGLVVGSILNTLQQTFTNVYVMVSQPDYYSRVTFVLIASMRTLDTDALVTKLMKYYPDARCLNQTEMDAIKKKCGKLILTDDYSPMDNLAAPISIHNQAATSANVYIAEAKKMIAADEWSQAIKLYMKAVQVCKPLLVKDYAEISERLLKHHEFEESHFVCEKALQYYDKPEIKTDISAINMNMSASLYGLGQYEKSKQYFNRAIEGYKRRLKVTPNAPDVLSNLGMALVIKGDLKEARSYLEQAVKVDPANSSNYFSLATVLIDQKDYSDAEITIKNAITAMKQIKNEKAVSQFQQLLEQVEYQMTQAKP
jgi:spermidine synthase/Tfp pilus assembly protein PilF